MHGVEGRLVAGIGMDRRHIAALDPGQFVQHFGYGGQAVGGARGVGDHQIGGSEGGVVHPKDYSFIGIGAGGGDQNPLGPRGQVSSGLFLGGEKARTFQGDIDAQIRVRQLRRVADGGDLDLAEADIDGVAIHRHRAGETAMDAVIAQQMGVGFH